MLLNLTNIMEIAKSIRKIKTSRFYGSARYLFGICYALITKKIFLTDFEIIDHIMACRWGSGRLKKLYQEKYTIENPLKLSILQQWKIEPKIFPEKYHYNPTILYSKNRILLCWRASGFTFGPHIDKHGIFKSDDVLTSENFEQLIVAEMELSSDSDMLLVKNERALANIHIVNEELIRGSLNKLNEPIFFEDPRFHFGDDDLISAHARFGLIEKNFIYRMALINIDSQKAHIIYAHDNSRTQKNWVAIQRVKNKLLMLNTSSPHVITEVNVSDGSSRNLMSQQKKPEFKMNLNGGSPFVLIRNKFYLRVARLHFPIYPIGHTRMNVLVMHALDFSEVSRSMPFVFNKLGCEICNGLTVRGDDILFSWGEDDARMYAGKTSIDSLLSWYEVNIQK